MTTNPLISVILPVYNTEKYLSESIESILRQTYANKEIICVDDGSTDASRDILLSYADQLTILQNEQNRGIAHSRNKGISVAQGEYLAFMDADDIWDPEKLKAQLDYLQKNPTLDMCFTYMRCFISHELPEEIKQQRYCPSNPIPGFLSATFLIKRASFEHVGLFTETWKVGEFIDWFERAKSAELAYGVLEDVFLLRRIHSTNTGVRDRSSRSDYVKIVREALARKKGNTL